MCDCGLHTCKIVSKLNVSPFHRVNSPLEAPVTSRRPSGVHCEENKHKYKRKLRLIQNPVSGTIYSAKLFSGLDSLLQIGSSEKNCCQQLAFQHLRRSSLQTQVES